MAESNQWVLSGETKTVSYIANAAGILVGQVRRHEKPKRLNDGDPASHYGTDAEWQSIIDLIAAAPALLAGLKELLAYDENSCGVGDFGYEVMQRCKAAVARAEPPRKVTRSVQIAINIEVEVEAGDADSEADAALELAIEKVRNGEGDVARHHFLD